MSEIIKLDNERFGDLINLPNILEQNKTSTLNATSVATILIEKARSFSLEGVVIEVYDGIDTELNDLYVKLDTTVKAQKSRREPMTQFFDEIRGLFTTEEKSVEGLKDQVKLLRNNWQKEKLRREKIRQDDLQKELDKKNEAVEISNYIKGTILKNISKEVQVTFTVLSHAFYSKTLEEMDGLKASMEKYTPKTGEEWFRTMATAPGIITLHHTAEEVNIFIDEALAEINPLMAELYWDKVIAERNRLIELIPSRKMELERIAQDANLKANADKRIADEQAAAQLKLEQEQQAQQQQQQATAEVEKLNTLFEVHGEASPVIELAKGTSVKKAYKATTHAAHLAIIQSWITHELPGMSIDDLNTKLSFMRTFANKRLNEGEVIKANGLIVEEDVVTRGRKSKVV